MAKRRHSRASGRFLLRIPPGLHEAIQAAARTAKLSVNEYCVRRLAAAGTGLSLEMDAAVLVTRAADVAGGALVGVVVYGSWIRGEAGPSSDVDALVVVDESCELTRTLYRTWDAAPATWHGATVDPHFVHLPGDRPVGGLWGEVALDGVVVFERALDITSHLGRVRRDIAAGRLVRRVVHGQPYWTAAA
jgi:hypothetical protein